MIARQLAHEVFGTALGNGAQVVDRFLGRHANAVVGNGQGLGLGVKRQTHFQIGLVFVQRVVVQGFKAQFVAGIGCVGHQFADKNFGIGIERMGYQVQKLGHFGLEGMGLFGHLRIYKLQLRTDFVGAQSASMGSIHPATP